MELVTNQHWILTIKSPSAAIETPLGQSDLRTETVVCYLFMWMDLQVKWIKE